MFPQRKLRDKPRINWKTLHFGEKLPRLKTTRSKHREVLHGTYEIERIIHRKRTSDEPYFRKKKKDDYGVYGGYGISGVYNAGLSTDDENGDIFTVEAFSEKKLNSIKNAKSDFSDLYTRSNEVNESSVHEIEKSGTSEEVVDKYKTMEAEGIKELEDEIPLQRKMSTGSLPTHLEELKRKNDHLAVEGYFLGRARALTGESKSNDDASDLRRRIRITEVVPSHSSIFSADKEEDKEWKMSLVAFTEKKHGPEFDKSFTKRLRTYYKAQDDLITMYEDMQLGIDDVTEKVDTQASVQKKAGVYAKITFFANVVLLVAKVVASVISGSISIISSLIDSVVDLASGIVIWVTSAVMKRKNPYVYPQGRTRLEPIAIVVLSVIMSLASVQLIREAATKIISLSDGSGSIPNVDVVTIVITASTIVIKLVLFLLCRRIKSPSVQVLSQDHRNDVLSNSIALIFGYIGSQDMKNRTGVSELVYLDPIGAILISIYIAINWWKTGYEQTRLLTGHTAAPDFLKKLTWMCINHHPKIRYIETLRAFHFGNNFLVEVDVILPEDMTLKESHDIAEPLQQKLERLPEVERAFVHVDYEYEHRPTDEHKVV